MTDRLLSGPRRMPADFRVGVWLAWGFVESQSYGRNSLPKWWLRWDSTSTDHARDDPRRPVSGTLDTILGHVG